MLQCSVLTNSAAFMLLVYSELLYARCCHTTAYQQCGDNAAVATVAAAVSSGRYPTRHMLTI
jgi:hypothetical protein